jgi:TonB family protein
MREPVRHFLWGVASLLCLSLPALAAEDACQQCFSPPNGNPVCVRNSGVRPVVATHRIPPYPQLSVMTNEQGTSLLSVEIGPDGVPTDVQILNSSGSLRLDEAARDYVKETWRWTPPLKECGATAPKLRVSIKWDLRDAPSDDLPRPPVLTMTEADFPPDALRRKEQGTTFIFLVVRDNASVALAQVAKSSGFPDLDEKALELAKSRYHWIPALMDGKPVTTPMYIGILWQSGPPAR